jgi:hypothetical protein
MTMLRKVIALLFLGAVVACAQSITIQNPGFENATLPMNLGTGPFCNLIPGSTVYPTGGTVTNWTAATTTANSAVGAVAPIIGGTNWTSKWWSGNNVAYIVVAAPGTASLSQTLSATLQNGTTYTLSMLVGRPTDSPGFNYALQLWAGSTLLASASNLLGLATNSSGMESVSYYSGTNNPQAGQTLEIVITSDVEVFFDNISLVASNGPAATNVLPQLAFGGGWYTALYFTNTTTSPVSFPVNLIDGNGNPLSAAPIGGTSTTVNLPARGTASIQFPNAGSLVQGYVSLALPSGVTGYGVFRQSVPGEPAQEAVVPLSGVTNTISTLLFDNTNGIITSFALVNLSNATAANATAYDPNGNVLGTATIPLAPNGQTAAALQSLIPATAGVLGSVDFTVPTGNVAALGLRFNGAALTSIPTSDR